MYIGSYELKLDEKNRFFMPSNFLTGDTYILTYIDKDLVLIKDANGWNAESLIDASKSKYDKTKLIDYINANSYICKLYGRRITIPIEIIKKLDFSRSITLVGCVDLIKMYDTFNYLETQYNEEVVRDLKKCINS